MRLRWSASLVLVLVATGAVVSTQSARAVSLVVTGGTVVTMDAAHTVIPRGAVAVG